MRKLVFFVVAIFQGHKDAQVVLAWAYTDARACELGTDLIESSSRDSPFWTVNVERRYWRVV